MRNVNKTVLSAADNQNTNGITIDANQLVSASFQAIFADSQAAGTFKIQASNDIFQDRYQASNFTVVNWVDVPNQSATITGGIGALLTIAQSSYRWLRAVYLTTGTGTQTIAVVPDVAGSLAGKSFLLSDEASAHRYQIWFKVSGVGSAPTPVAGYSLVEQDIATGDSAATIGAALASTIAALNATNSFTATGTSTVTVTNKTAGPFVPASDVNTGFTFAVTAGGMSTVSVNMNALSV